MKIITITDGQQHITESIKTLQSGGLVIFPSDTVYGLLVDATNKKAVEKLIKFKNRPPGKPISVFVPNVAMLEEQAYLDAGKKKLLEELIPGPFTIVLESKHRVSPLLESEKGTLGLRIPDYTPVEQLSSQFGGPITATSANLSGRSPHYSVESLLNELPQAKIDLIDLIVDAGRLPRNKPSTIIDLTQPEMKILRHGDVIWRDTRTYITRTPTETQKTAEFILQKQYVSDRALVFILQGDLGVGKTVFVKGLGKRLGIENIISPTFVIYYEYDLEITNLQNSKSNNRFVHVDLYNIEDPEEFKHLGIEQYLKPGNILAIEWGEKSGELFEEFRQKAHIVYITMEYIDEKGRKITISFK